VLSAERVDESFHARFSARWRGYIYRIESQQTALRRHHVWQYFKRPELLVLQDLADEIRGTHSFTAFAHEKPEEDHNYECTVFRSEWSEAGTSLEYRIEASRFLHGMVRMLVGTMMDISLGARSMAGSDMSEILTARDNRRAGTKAPACGLTLHAVGYGPWPQL
jgi:tRNA pseudouridine38-40 synthase